MKQEVDPETDKLNFSVKCGFHMNFCGVHVTVSEHTPTICDITALFVGWARKPPIREHQTTMAHFKLKMSYCIFCMLRYTL